MIVSLTFFLPVKMAVNNHLVAALFILALVALIGVVAYPRTADKTKFWFGMVVLVALALLAISVIYSEHRGSVRAVSRR